MAMKRYKPSLSIGTKTLLSHLTLAIVVTTLASVLSYAISSHYIRQTRVNELIIKAQRIAESTHASADGGVVPSRRTVRIYEELTDAKVFFLDTESGTIRMSQYHTDADGDSGDDIQWVEVLDSIDRQFVGRVISGEKVSALRRFEFAQDVILFAGVPIADETGMVRGGVILAQPIAQLRSLSRMIRAMLAVVVGVSVLLAVLLSMQEARMLVRPIQRITRAARRMEDGLYAERISALPDNEIGDLGRALNSMSGRLMDVIRNLRKERDKLELVVSGMGEGLIAVDTRWHIVHANTAFLELTELDSAKDFLREDDTFSGFAPLRALLDECMRTGEAKETEWENASRRAVSATASALRDESGEILGTVCLLRDVSETQRLEQLRRDYVANISHELRTPLTGIRGMVEPLIDGCMDTEEERQESYRVILNETIRLEKLVGEMLDLSRLQDGRLVVELEPMELPGILEAAARSMKSIADNAGVTLTVETDDTPLACLGNEGRITQVLVILLDNALSFTPRGGTVTVFARDAGERVEVGVRDTGCGIEPKDLPLIWERFYKADKSRMRTTGTGLGLAIAKLVTHLMGGDIWVRSELGKGAEFTFTLKKP